MSLTKEAETLSKQSSAVEITSMYLTLGQPPPSKIHKMALAGTQKKGQKDKKVDEYSQCILHRVAAIS